MATLRLRDGTVWGASGATLTMLLRYAAQQASDPARAKIDHVLAANGIGLDLQAIADEPLVAELEAALLAGSRRMQEGLTAMAELASELEDELSGVQGLDLGTDGNGPT